jgi:sterol desaturase/sphingolipid hydroxylase (fatty acid hydroxylase superfamily)
MTSRRRRAVWPWRRVAASLVAALMAWLTVAPALAQAGNAAQGEVVAPPPGEPPLAEDEVWVERSLAEQWFGKYAEISAGVVAYLKELAWIGLIFLPFQLLVPMVRRPWKVRTYEFFLEVLFWLQTMWWGFLGFFVLIAELTRLIVPGGPFFPALASLPFVVQVVMCVVAYDFIVYWRHRAEHTFTPLWAFHSVHHTATQVDWLTTVRLHPVELIIGAVLNAFAVRAGFDRGAVALGFGIYLHYNYFIHSNIRLRMPGWLKYVFVTPFMHQWHHARGKETYGKNVGVVFAWNDWLFGTAYHPDAWPERFGLDANPDEQVSQSYLKLMVYPFRVLWARRRHLLWAKATTIEGTRDDEEAALNLPADAAVATAPPS